MTVDEQQFHLPITSEIGQFKFDFVKVEVTSLGETNIKWLINFIENLFQYLKHSIHIFLIKKLFPG